VTAAVTATAANYGERPRTLADDKWWREIRGGRWRTSANVGEQGGHGLENH